MFRGLMQKTTFVILAGTMEHIITTACNTRMIKINVISELQLLEKFGLG